MRLTTSGYKGWFGSRFEHQQEAGAPVCINHWCWFKISQWSGILLTRGFRALYLGDDFKQDSSHSTLTLQIEGYALTENETCRFFYELIKIATNLINIPGD
jgi:hypothetical protein